MKKTIGLFSLLASVFALTIAQAASVPLVPEGYTVIKYVSSEASGNPWASNTVGPYIKLTNADDSNFQPEGTDTVEVKYAFTKQLASTEKSSCWLFCTRESGNGKFSFLRTSDPGSGFRYDYADKTASVTPASTYNTTSTHTVRVNSSGIYFDGSSTPAVTVSGASAYKQASTPTLLFAAHSDSAGVSTASTESGYGTARIYYFRVLKADGSCRMNLVPMKDANGVAGMYDQVSGQFFTSASSYALTAGGNATLADILESFTPGTDPAATGGDYVLKDGDAYLHVFTSSATLTLSSNTTADMLLVGGGGGGGYNAAGGGAGGAVVEIANKSISAGSYAVTVGAGGAHETSQSYIWGGTGGTSSVADIDGASAAGGSGGVGWKGSSDGGDTLKDCAGWGGSNGTSYGAGGGSNTQSNGGDGKASEILGVSIVFGGGGGKGDGAQANSNLLQGGAGGGGQGACRYANGNSSTAGAGLAKNGTNFLGGGGGGGAGGGQQDQACTSGADGGSGIVVIRVTPGGDDPDDPTVIQIPTGANLTYTGAEQTGVAAGTGYELSGTFAATDADNYTATATLTDATNTKWSDETTEPKTIDWSIAKATPAITGTLTMSGWTEGETASEPSGLSSSFGTVVYAYYSDQACTTSIEKPTTAGTYYVRGEVAADTNWNAANSVAVSFTISPRGVVVTYYKVGTDPSDAKGQNSWVKSCSSTVGWSLTQGGAVVADHQVSENGRYIVPNGAVLRSPSNANDAGDDYVQQPFGGAELVLQTGGFLYLQSVGSGYGDAAKADGSGANLVKVPNLIAEGGTILHATTGYRKRLEGAIEVRSAGLVVKQNNSGAGQSRSLTIASAITGSGPIVLASATHDSAEQYLWFTGDLSGFTGTIQIDSATAGHLQNEDFRITGAFGGTITALPEGFTSVEVNYAGLQGGKGLRVASTTIPTALRTKLTLFGSTTDFTAANLPLMTFPAGTTVDSSAFTVKHATAVDGTPTAFADLATVTNGDGTITLVANSGDPTKIDVPAAKTGLVYTGSEQIGVDAGEGYTLTGNKGTGADTYTATASLADKAGTTWSDDTTADKQIPWSIAKATPVISGTLVMAGWTEGGTASEPSGLSSSFGTVAYVYYSDQACTASIAKPTTTGTYYVRGEVAADTNWNAANSAAVAFTISAQAGELVLTSPITTAANPIELLTADQKTWLGFDRLTRRALLSGKPIEGASVPAEWETKDIHLFSGGSPVSFTWEGTTAPCTVSLKRLSDNQTVWTKTDVTGTSLTVYNLEVGAGYEWTVTCGAASESAVFYTSAQPPRLLKAGAMTQVRDLGGWTGLQNCKIRQNRIIRGSAANGSTETGNVNTRLADGQAVDFFVNELGIKHEIDMRKSGEDGVGTNPNTKIDTTGSKIAYHNLYVYKYLLHKDEDAPNLKAIFDLLFNAASEPVYFHCAAGRDRTGMIGALTEALLGVSEEDIWRDYQATATMPVYPDLCDQRYIDFAAMLDFLKEQEGETLAEQAATYFKTLGFTAREIENFRASMLVGYEPEEIPDDPVGVTYYLVGADKSGSSSFAESSSATVGWAVTQGGSVIADHAVSALNDYVVPSGSTLRTTGSNDDNDSFRGKTLTIAGGELSLKRSGSSTQASKTTTIPQLILTDGGVIHHANDRTDFTLAGNTITIPEEEVGVIELASNNRRGITVNSKLAGAGTLQLKWGGSSAPSSQDSYLKLAGDNSGFTGTITENGDESLANTKYTLVLDGAFGGTITSLPKAKTNSIKVNYGNNAGLTVATTTIPAALKTDLVFYGSADFTAANLPLVTFPSGTSVDPTEFMVKHASSESGSAAAFTNLGTVTDLGGTITLVANVSSGKTMIVDSMVTLSKTTATIDDADYATLPAVAVNDGTRDLVLGADYTVSWSPAAVSGAGTYTATITDLGDYDGSVTKTYVVTIANAYYLVGQDADKTSSFVKSSTDEIGWSETEGGTVLADHLVAAGNHYVVPTGTTLRTPYDTPNVDPTNVFNGASLTLAGELNFRAATGTGRRIVTIDNLMADGGTVNTKSTSNHPLALDGSIVVPEGESLTFDLTGATDATHFRDLLVTSTITGGGTIKVGLGDSQDINGNTFLGKNSVIDFAGDMSGFTGEIDRLDSTKVDSYTFVLSGFSFGGSIKNLPDRNHDPNFVFNWEGLPAAKGVVISGEGFPPCMRYRSVFYNIDTNVYNVALFTFLQARGTKASGGGTFDNTTLDMDSVRHVAAGPGAKRTAIDMAQAQGGDDPKIDASKISCAEPGDGTCTWFLHYDPTVVTTVISGTISMPGWNEGNPASEPSGLSVNPGGGPIVYKYYADAACTQALAEKPTMVGTYWVRGEVANGRVSEEEKWTAARSEAVSFRVHEPATVVYLQ